MFEQAFKNIDDVLRKEAGCTTELDYTEQTSWLLFLKYLDGLEEDKAAEAELERRKYTHNPPPRLPSPPQARRPRRAEKIPASSGLQRRTVICQKDGNMVKCLYEDDDSTPG
jgi:HsdM-like protein